MNKLINKRIDGGSRFLLNEDGHGVVAVIVAFMVWSIMVFSCVVDFYFLKDTIKNKDETQDYLVPDVSMSVVSIFFSAVVITIYVAQVIGVTHEVYQASTPPFIAQTGQLGVVR
jgi:hypothetical protein